MKNILFYIAGFCLLSLALGVERQLDSTLLVDKNGLTVINSASSIQFKCRKEWSVTFTDNGQTAALRVKNGIWTLTGLSTDIAVAAISEAGPLVSGIAGGVGASDADIQDITSRTLALATTLAQNIGQDTFDSALVTAVDVANDVLDEQGIHPIDFNEEIFSALTHLGPSGIIVDASDVTVQEVHRDATKTIGIILNALASSGAISLSQVSAAQEASVASIAAAAVATGKISELPAKDDASLAAAAAAATSSGIDLSHLTAEDTSSLAAAATANGVDLSQLTAGDISLATAAAVAAEKKQA